MEEIEEKSSKKGFKRSKTVEEIYTKKTQLEHILLRPDTYIGSIERHTQPMWILDSLSKKITQRTCTFVPGLYKIFDEILVNAADNKQRDPTMSKIDVMIAPEEGFISVYNNGKSIPVVIHKDHKVYIPELVFGHLLTGSNFDDEEAKTTGGRNGYGAKLANIFSTKFIIEVGDSTTGSLYKQEFQQNMTKIHPPKIKTNFTGKDYIKVIFYPDFPKFGMTRLDDDIIALFSKRVYDIAGTTISKGSKLNVSLNGIKIEGIKKFEDYLQLYEGMEPPIVVEKINDRWEVGVGPSDGSFQQISFVNSISTNKGGAHITYITEQLTTRLIQTVKRKNKDELKPNQIKNHLSIFINCLITNPSFDSQTKEYLTTKPSAFGSSCQLTEKIFKAIEKSIIIENIHNWAKFKQTAELKKKSGSKRSKLLGITKLDDANHAGTSKSSQCTLILTEGDSAKALAISGLGVVGRDYYGVFPLKGKLLNVREASHSQIMKNEEIQNITKILGLTFGKVYTDTTSLRYGHLMIMTDQDHDGSHIKGLLINFIHYFWPSLLQIPNFLQQFITPIIKCFKGKTQISFYTIPEYHSWKINHQNEKGWKIKYYKGLGTSTAQEAKEYFSNLNIHEISFEWDQQANDMIDMAFAKKRVEERKLWLLAKPPGVFIDYSMNTITYNHFINHELILFSYADNERSIAHMMDGLKPSQRKVLYSCFKRNLVSQEIKVAQLAGYVSEHSAYHHGEASLTQTIVGMAQNFVGSNNINLLAPCGQFGTRLMGGKDAASARYIFTKLEEITRYIFHPDDDDLLDYLEEDGQSIEPAYYIPIIPMALVNGSEGIGTGWSSTIPNYHPIEIIQNLKRMIAGEEPMDMIPWFRGFLGKIQGKEGKVTTNFTVSGLIDKLDEQTVQITELPIGKWTTDYKQYLESVLIGNTAATGVGGAEKNPGEEGVPASAASAAFVKDFKENHTDTTVLFTVTCPSERLEDFNNEQSEKLIKKFKLETSISTTNMHLFDINSQIKKFEGPLNVIKEFFLVRLQYYIKRRQLLCNKLEKEWRILENKMRFVTEIIEGKLVVTNRPKKDLLKDLKQRKYELFFDKETGGTAEAEGDHEAEAEEELTTEVHNLEKGYNYLLNLKIWNLTNEKVRQLKAQCEKTQEELEKLKAKTAEMLWIEDLDRLEQAINRLYAERSEEEGAQRLQSKKNAKSRGNGAKPVIKRPRAANPKPKPPANPTASKKKKEESDEESEDSSSSDDDADSELTEEDSDESFEIKKPKKSSTLTVNEKPLPASKPKQRLKKEPPAAVPQTKPNVQSKEIKTESSLKGSATKRPAKINRKKKYDSDESDDESHDYDSELLSDDDEDESESSDEDFNESDDNKGIMRRKSTASVNESKLLEKSSEKNPPRSSSIAKSSKKEAKEEPMSRQGSNNTTTTVASASTLPKTGSTSVTPEKKTIIGIKRPVSSISKPIMIDDDWGADDNQLIILSSTIHKSPNTKVVTSSHTILSNEDKKVPAAPSEKPEMRQKKITTYAQYFSAGNEDELDDSDEENKPKRKIAKTTALPASSVKTNPSSSSSNKKPTEVHAPSASSEGKKQSSSSTKKKPPASTSKKVTKKRKIKEDIFDTSEDSPSDDDDEDDSDFSD